MSNFSNNFQMTYLSQNQLAKDIVINKNIQILDNLMHIKAIDMSQSPPPNAAEGDVYIVANGANDLWLGKDKMIAIYTNQAWFFINPVAKCSCYLLYWYGHIFYDGYNWRIASAAPRIGDYKLSAQEADHDNWLLCDGRDLARDKYGNLFSTIKTNFGSKSSTTFTIPKIDKNANQQNCFIFVGLV